MLTFLSDKFDQRCLGGTLTMAKAIDAAHKLFVAFLGVSTLASAGCVRLTAARLFAA